MLGTGKFRVLFGVLGPRARLQSEYKRIASSWIFRTSWETPITQPSCPTASLTIRLTPPTPHTHRFTISQLRAPGRRFAQLRCSLSREQSVRGVGGGVNQDTPSWEGLGAGAFCSSSYPVRRRRRLADVCQHPLLLPQRGFPLLSLF